MKKTFNLIIAGFMLLMITSCAKKADEFSGDWVLQSFEVGTNSEVVQNITLSVEKEEGNSRYNFSGFSGVNTFNGVFITGSKGKVSCDGEVASTKMSGAMDSMEVENKFLQALEDADGWTIKEVDGAKILEVTSVSADMDANKSVQAVLKFIKFTLAGSAWKVDAIGNDAALDTLKKESNLSIKFISDNKVTFDTGLNNLELDYKINTSSHSISFSQAGLSTSASGSDEDMRVEKEFIAAILQTNSYIFSGDTLEFHSLSGNAGTILITAQRVTE